MQVEQQATVAPTMAHLRAAMRAGHRTPEAIQLRTGWNSPPSILDPLLRSPFLHTLADDVTMTEAVSTVQRHVLRGLGLDKFTP
jgi:hypothetical protein